MVADFFAAGFFEAGAAGDFWSMSSIIWSSCERSVTSTAGVAAPPLPTTKSGSRASAANRHGAGPRSKRLQTSRCQAGLPFANSVLWPTGLPATSGSPALSTAYRSCHSMRLVTQASAARLAPPYPQTPTTRVQAGGPATRSNAVFTSRPHQTADPVSVVTEMSIPWNTQSDSSSPFSSR